MKNSSSLQTTLRLALHAVVPVVAGYLVLGAAFGILLYDAGYGFIWSLLMSTFIYAGSMEFAGVSLLTGGATLVSTALMTLLVNARHMLYGISMLDQYRDMGPAKPYLIFSLTDETYAVLCGGTPEGADRRLYPLLVSFIDQLCWVIGSLLGSLIGSSLSINTAGIDFAMTALFLVIFVEQLLSTRDHLPAAAGVGISLLCLVLCGPDRFLIPSMVLLLASLTLYGMLLERRASA